MRTKGSDAPVITGLPVSDGSSVDQNRFDEDLLNEVNTTLTDFQNRRRLTAAPSLNTSYWYMSGTLSRDLTLDACGLLRDGHSTYTTRLSEVVVDPLDATEINFLTMHKVDIKGATGCDGLSRLIVYFNVDDEPVEVKCPLDITKDTCGMYRPGITFTNSSSTFTNDTGVYGGDDRRRLLLDEDFTLEEGMVDYENGWDSELNSQ